MNKQRRLLMAIEEILTELNYVDKINKALSNHKNTISIFTEIIKFINDFYKKVEPGNHEGKITVFKTLSPDLKPIEYSQENYLFDFVNIMNNKRTDIIIQIKDDMPYLFWQNESLDIFELSTKAIIYEYEKNDEKFYANREIIPIEKRMETSSMFATYFADLRQALSDYSQTHIRYSSCSTFNTVWNDTFRIFFKKSPESAIQKSLNDFLRNRLNLKIDIGEINREHNTDNSNPVDIRVLWKKASRSALVEIKWLGKSLNDEGKITANYSDARAVEGVKQLKKYLDKNNQSNPTQITKGFLVVIDGRRNSVNANTKSINRKDGLHYENKELDFGDSINIFKNNNNFENPIRMFAEPICQD